MDVRIPGISGRTEGAQRSAAEAMAQSPAPDADTRREDAG
jgi:hypothetical protein